MSADQLMQTIRGRRSVGQVTSTPVSRDTIRRIVEAGLWAPNHKMTQPMRVIVISGEARSALADAHAAARKRLSPDLTEEVMAAQKALTHRAPHILVVMQRFTSDDPVVRREDRDTVAAAVQNMLLYIHEAGLAAYWRTGAMADEDEVREYLDAGPGDEIIGFIYLGHPAGPPPAAPTRPPVDTILEWRGDVP